MTSMRHLNRPGRLAFGSAARRAPGSRRRHRRRASRRSRPPPSQLHRRAGRSGTNRLRRALRLVPRPEPGRRRVRAAAQGHRLPAAMGRGNPRRRCSRTPSTKMPPARPGSLGDAELRAASRLHASGKRDEARHARAAGRSRCAARDGGARLAPRRRRRAGARRGRAAGSGPAQSARQDSPGHRGDADARRRRRVADVAAHLRCVRLQPAQEDQSHQRRAIFASAWTWSLPNGPNQSTPIVHDGVLFVHSYGDKVQALDAATGDLLWQYSRRLPTGVAPSVKRGISIYGTPPLRADLGRAHRRARREDRDGGLGPGGRRPEGRLPHDRRHAGRAREGDGRHDRPRRGRQLHRRARRGDRKGSLAVLYDRAARTSRAARAGTGCRSKSETAARSGFPAATIRCRTWRSSRRAIPTTPARSEPWSTNRA